jgi:hypothetical protein
VLYKKDKENKSIWYENIVCSMISPGIFVDSRKSNKDNFVFFMIILGKEI